MVVNPAVKVLAALIFFLPYVLKAEQPSQKEVYSCDMWMVQTERIDLIRARTFSSVCKSSRWFDGLFGDSEEFDGSKVEGWLNLGMDIDTSSGVKPRLRLNFSTDLPNANKRYNLFIGRLNEEEFVSNTEADHSGSRSTGFKSTEDEVESWMLGLGYQKRRDNGVKFDYSAGAKLRSSGLFPYVRARRRHQIPMPENRQLFNSQTLFWRQDEGFGFSADFLYERTKNKSKSAVFHPAVKYQTNDNRWEWVARLKFYRQISDDSALKYTWYLRDNESDSSMGVNNELGLQLDYRRRFLRDWFYLVPSATLSWERRDNRKDFEPELFLGLRVEMAFDKNAKAFYRLKNRSR